MAKDKGKDPEKIEVSEDEQAKLLEDAQDFEDQSYRYLSNVRKDWPDKESMLLGVRPEDKLSQKTKSKVVGNQLSTMTFERASRVMAQNAVGRASAVSKNDVGKNLLMNMLLKYYQGKANEEGSHLLKLRQMDVYSHVYGSMFALVPWRVNRLNGYIGPELLPINMRDIRPQPGRRTIDKMDQFGVRSVVSLNWLKKQDKKVWLNVDKLEAELKEAKDPGESGRTNSRDVKSYVEQQRYPTTVGDSTFPDIEMFTNYQYDRWITWCPRFADIEGSRPHILRVVTNPYPKGYLPIIVKHAFPLMDSIIGLGDFERGKTLQFAANSLVNLLLDGVKYAIFPPVHVNLDEVDPTSLVWGAGNKWYMTRPNQSVQAMRTNSQEWMGTFQSTFGLLSSLIQNLSGGTQASATPGQTPSLGKTPDAVKQYGLSQSARDEWDRFMMEDMLGNQLYPRWTALIAAKMEVPLTMRIFGPEIRDLQATYKDENVLEVFESKTRGNIKVSKDLLNDKDGDEPTKYDFELESGSTMQRGNMDEGEAASQTIKDFQDAPWMLEEIRKKGKDIDFAELYKRRMIGGGIKDWDKILISPEDNLGDHGTQEVLVDGAGGPVAPVVPGTTPEVVPPDGAAPALPPGAQAPAQTQPVAAPGGGKFKDEAVAQVAEQVLASAIQGGPVA